MGFERPAPVHTLVQKHAGGMFLGRGRIPVQLTASDQDVGSCAAQSQKSSWGGFFFFVDLGFEPFKCNRVYFAKDIFFSNH